MHSSLARGACSNHASVNLLYFLSFIHINTTFHERLPFEPNTFVIFVFLFFPVSPLRSEKCIPVITLTRSWSCRSESTRKGQWWLHVGKLWWTLAGNCKTQPNTDSPIPHCSLRLEKPSPNCDRHYNNFEAHRPRRFFHLGTTQDQGSSHDNNASVCVKVFRRCDVLIATCSLCSYDPSSGTVLEVKRVSISLALEYRDLGSLARW